MEKIIFLIQGSEKEPYEVIFHYENNIFSVTCSCAAGSSGQLCKHRLNLFAGDITALINDNKNDLNKALGWLKTTPIPYELKQLSLLEKEFEDMKDEMKKNISNKKKRIAKMLYGR